MGIASGGRSQTVRKWKAGRSAGTLLESRTDLWETKDGKGASQEEGGMGLGLIEHIHSWVGIWTHWPTLSSYARVHLLSVASCFLVNCLKLKTLSSGKLRRRWGWARWRGAFLLLLGTLGFGRNPAGRWGNLSLVDRPAAPFFKEQYLLFPLPHFSWSLSAGTCLSPEMLVNVMLKLWCLLHDSNVKAKGKSISLTQDERIVLTALTCFCPVGRGGDWVYWQTNKVTSEPQANLLLFYVFKSLEHKNGLTALQSVLWGFFKTF